METGKLNDCRFHDCGTVSDSGVYLCVCVGQGLGMEGDGLMNVMQSP